MTSRCIPANADISKIGVHPVIYAQNLFCFAPVIKNLWDGEISGAELDGVKDQYIGTFALPFAVLISTIVERTKPNQDTESEKRHKMKPIPATWAAWTGVLLSPVHRLVTRGAHEEMGLFAEDDIGETRWKSVARRAWDLYIHETGSYHRFPSFIADGGNRAMAVEQPLQVWFSYRQL
ncbi:hypothetical protein C8R45DRAFT_938776 [Mycena sanguinolenta]|nr:hypothetical protein C8R45DRAFT_938776 [Mycena sanguinolenta]